MAAGMNDLPKNLITYIVLRLQDEEVPITSTRLIKLLYLIDLEHTIKFGTPLTNISWVRYKHGPYFWEWNTLLKATQLDINPEEVTTEAGYRAITYRTYEEPRLDKFVPKYASQVLINNILNRWMFEDLDVILEHVYDTEPMYHAELEQPLDLTLAQDVALANEALATADDILTSEEIFEALGFDEGELEAIELDDLE